MAATNTTGIVLVAFRAGRTAATKRHDVVARRNHVREPFVVVRQRDVDPGERQARRQTLDRVLQERLALDRRVLLGFARAEAGAVSRGGKQREITGH